MMNVRILSFSSDGLSGNGVIDSRYGKMTGLESAEPHEVSDIWIERTKEFFSGKAEELSFYLSTHPSIISVNKPGIKTHFC